MRACRDLAFPGMTGKAIVSLMPTVNCLMQLVEPPYTVIPLADMELASLERVGFNGKSFDLVIVFKVCPPAACVCGGPRAGPSSLAGRLFFVA